jgi:hypothetical protein
MFSGSWRRAAVVLTVAGVLGCSPEKPAQNAIAAAEEALAAASVDAQTYAADAYVMATTKIAEAKQALEQQDYKLATASAGEATTAIEGFAAAIETKKAELGEMWTALSGELPGTVTAIDARIEELSKMRRLPAGMTKATLDGAKASTAELRTMWGEAVAAFDGGNLMEAVMKGSACKDKALEVKGALVME